MKRKSPASGKRQGLDNDPHKFDSSTNPTKLRTLEQISRKWVTRGYYPTPSAAMKVLMEGCHE